MLCIDTIVKKSNISGLGLFANVDIPQGTVIWKFEPKLDTLLKIEDIQNLSEEAIQQFLNYAFFDKSREKFMLCGDDARFFNHSEAPNCDDINTDITVAVRNIQKGEELTVDYKTFDGDITRHTFI